MTQGCLIFAYDGQIEYGCQAVLAARLVRKHLNIPTTLVTDSSTVNKLELTDMFDQVIFQENTDTNTRVLFNGPDSSSTVEFKNTNRSSAYNLSPYDRTLVIDSDFLVFSNRLAHYLNSNNDFMICNGMKDLYAGRPGSQVLLNPTSIPMLWATNIIFNKTPEVKAIFDMVDYILDNWEYYGALYKFNTARFRNDYAFSVACHELSNPQVALPQPLLFTSKDTLVKASDTGLTFLMSFNEDRLVKTQGQDIHMMNKQDLVNNIAALTELV
jgi:hypothetical protein